MDFENEKKQLSQLSDLVVDLINKSPDEMNISSVDEYEDILAGYINNYLLLVRQTFLELYEEKTDTSGQLRMLLLIEQKEKLGRDYVKNLNKYVQLEDQWDNAFDSDKFFNAITNLGSFILLTAIYKLSGQKIGVWVDIDSVKEDLEKYNRPDIIENLEEIIQRLIEAKLVQIEYDNSSKRKIGLTQAALIFVKD